MNRYTTAAKPKNIPNGWVVMRATRPLVGDMAWKNSMVFKGHWSEEEVEDVDEKFAWNEFQWRWYVAIDPDTRDAQRMIDLNLGLDGCIVQYVTDDAVLAAYLADLPEKLASRYHAGLRQMCIKNAIRKLDDGSMTM
jgi:hypothetical protein